MYIQQTFCLFYHFKLSATETSEFINSELLNQPKSTILFHKKKLLQGFFTRILAGSAVFPTGAFVPFHLQIRQRPGIELVVRDLAYHVIGLKTQCLWVTLTAIPGLHWALCINFFQNLITYSNSKINNLFSLSQSGSTGSCDFQSTDTMATVRGYETLPRNNLEAVMNHLANNGPLSVAGKTKIKYCALA